MKYYKLASQMRGFFTSFGAIFEGALLNIYEQKISIEYYFSEVDK